jgi:hypothetical protein
MNKGQPIREIGLAPGRRKIPSSPAAFSCEKMASKLRIGRVSGTGGKYCARSSGVVFRGAYLTAGQVEHLMFGDGSFHGKAQSPRNIARVDHSQEILPR